jgi:DNA-binding LytR/AlgR family response regulator
VVPNAALFSSNPLTIFVMRFSKKRRRSQYKAISNDQLLSRKVAKGQVRSYNQKLTGELDEHADRLDKLESQLVELQASHQLLPIPNQKGVYFQLIGEIIYCEAQSNQTDIHCVDHNFQAVNVLLKDLYEQLQPYGFLRIHQSFLVNKRFVRKLQDRRLELKDGTVLQVSRRYFAEIRAELKTGYL